MESEQPINVVGCNRILFKFKRGWGEGCVAYELPFIRQTTLNLPFFLAIYRKGINFNSPYYPRAETAVFANFQDRALQRWVGYASLSSESKIPIRQRRL